MFELDVTLLCRHDIYEGIPWLEKWTSPESCPVLYLNLIFNKFYLISGLAISDFLISKVLSTEVVNAAVHKNN